MLVEVARHAQRMETATDWTFGGLWPHPPSWFETAHGRMHYVDVGPRDAQPVVLVHGNPTWGFVYRKFIGALVRAGHRVIVPDHLGFGRSDKPNDPRVHRARAHAERLNALLESLGLQQVSVVVHDWGGPMALYWATRHAERVRNLVVFNTVVRRPETRVALPLPLRVFRMRGLGELLVKRLHGIVRAFLFRAGVRTALEAEVQRGYLAAHPSTADRTGILALAREFPVCPGGPVADLFGEVHAGLGRLKHCRTLIVWAMQDVVFGNETLEGWISDFPEARVVRLDKSRHFLQEDAHSTVVPTVVSFLAVP